MSYTPEPFWIFVNDRLAAEVLGISTAMEKGRSLSGKHPTTTVEVRATNGSRAWEYDRDRGFVETTTIKL